MQAVREVLFRRMPGDDEESGGHAGQLVGRLEVIVGHLVDGVGEELDELRRLGGAEVGEAVQVECPAGVAEEPLARLPDDREVVAQERERVGPSVRVARAEGARPEHAAVVDQGLDVEVCLRVGVVDDDQTALGTAVGEDPSGADGLAHRVAVELGGEHLAAQGRPDTDVVTELEVVEFDEPGLRTAPGVGTQHELVSGVHVVDHGHGLAAEGVEQVDDDFQHGEVPFGEW